MHHRDDPQRSGQSESGHSSLNAVCDDLDDMADGNTLREHLNAAMDVTELPRQDAERRRR